MTNRPDQPPSEKWMSMFGRALRSPLELRRLRRALSGAESIEGLNAEEVRQLRQAMARLERASATSSQKIRCVFARYDGLIK